MTGRADDQLGIGGAAAISQGRAVLLLQLLQLMKNQVAMVANTGSLRLQCMLIELLPILAVAVLGLKPQRRPAASATFQRLAAMISNTHGLGFGMGLDAAVRLPAQLKVVQIEQGAGH